MDLDLQPGKYVVAVSGGVDSVVLLDLLVKQASKFQIPNSKFQEEPTENVIPGLTRNLKLEQGMDSRLLGNDKGTGYKFVVAHFDHGIREDSAEDRRLVQALAKGYGLPFVYHRGELGAGVSEAAARKARYEFLHNVRQASRAGAIVTAHHQDDVLETIILNLLRGTGRRGLSSLKSTDIVKRPLLHVPKKELLRYAEREGLRWREDSTNTDERYLRNYIRHSILPRFAARDREALYVIGRWAHKMNREISVQVSNYLHLQPRVGLLDRHSFIMLPHAVAREVMAEWLLQNTGAELSRKLLERLVVAAKTGRAGTRVDVDAGHWLEISRQTLGLSHK